MKSWIQSNWSENLSMYPALYHIISVDCWRYSVCGKWDAMYMFVMYLKIAELQDTTLSVLIFLSCMYVCLCPAQNVWSCWAVIIWPQYWGGATVHKFGFGSFFFWQLPFFFGAQCTWFLTLIWKISQAEDIFGVILFRARASFGGQFGPSPSYPLPNSRATLYWH